jgi:hypothetical protein
MRADNNYLEKQEMSTLATTATSSERRKRLKLKRIVVSQQNYLALKSLGYTGDSFNDVISKLLRIQRNYQEKQQQQDRQEENSSTTSTARFFFPGVFLNRFSRIVSS